MAEPLLAISLTTHRVQAAFGNQSDTAVSEPVEYQPKQLVQRVDQALQQLGPESEQTNRVVFLLSHDSVDQAGQLQPEAKDQLRQVVKELGLSPLGYLVTSELVLQGGLQADEARSMLAIVVTQDTLILTGLWQGRAWQAITISASQNLTSDLIEAQAVLRQQLDTQAPECWPQEWQLVGHNVDQAVLEAAGDELRNYDWSNQPNCPVTPTITVLSSGFLLTRALRHFITEQSALATTEPPPQLASADKVVPKQSVGKQQTKLAKFLHILLGIVSGLFFLLLAFFIWNNWFLTAQLLITPNQTIVSQQLILTLDTTTNQPDVASLLLPAQPITTQITQTQTVVATGEVEVGDRAQGQVEVFNKTNLEVVLAAGTQLTNNQVTLLLDESLTIPPAETEESEDGSGETTTFGQASGPATAGQPGTAGNLAADTELEVAGFDDTEVSGQVSTSFSGGTSRQVSAVAQQDIDQAVADIESEVEQLAADTLHDEADSGQVVVVTEVALVGTESDVPVGEEANSVTVSASFTISCLVYDRQQVESLAQTLVAEELPPNFVLVDQGFELLSRPTAASQGDQQQVEVAITAPAQAIIDEEALLAELVARPIAGLDDIDESLLIQAIEVRFLPAIAELWRSRLPTRSANLTINVQ